MPSFLSAVYYGEVALDRRHTPAMLPWVVADVRRTGERRGSRHVQLVVGTATLKALEATSTGEVVVFEHRLQTLMRFSRAQHEPRCFSYLTRLNSELPFTCHVFSAAEESAVQQLLNIVQQATLAVSSPSVAGINETYLTSVSHHLYEVLYVGKMIVSTKKAPPTFIDDAVRKFDEYSRSQSTASDDWKAGRRRERHESDVSVQSLPADLERTVQKDERNSSKQHATVNPLQEAFETDTDSSHYRTSSSGSEDAFLAGVGSSSTRSEAFEIVNMSELGSVGGSSDSVYDPALAGSRKESSGSEKMMQQVIKTEAFKLQQQLEAKSSSASEQRNKTMLIQVGGKELLLISLDRKSVIFERQFKDISFCSQGITYPEHFGFISRDPDGGNFTCYVFRCATESVVEEIMLTLKQAFQSAFQQNTGKNLVVCELCPMHQLNKLCQQLDKLGSEQTRDLLQQRLNQLTDVDQQEIKSHIKTGGALPLTNDWNELAMSALLHLSEKKQREHVHLGDIERSSHGKYDFILTSTPAGGTSKFDEYYNLARRSFGSSLEQLLKGRDNDKNHQVRERETMTNSSTSSLDSRDEVERRLPDVVNMTSSSGLLQISPRDSFLLPVTHGTPLLGVPELRYRRHSTPHQPTTNLGHSPLYEDDGDASAETANTSQQGDNTSRSPIPRNSPMRSMFAKVGNSDPTEGGCPVPNTVAVKNRSSNIAAAQSVSVNHAPQQSHQQVRGQRSWRLGILSSVVSDNGQTNSGRSTLSGTSIADAFGHGYIGKVKSPLSTRKMRALWQKAIQETVLLVRMNKENKIHVSVPSSQLSNSVVDAGSQQCMVDYEEITPCLKEVTKVWDRLLCAENRAVTKVDPDTLTKAVRDGVPRTIRGDIWQLLVEQHRLHHGDVNNCIDVSGEELYLNLLKRLTLHQHAILIDLGRTFPGHPYFSIQLGPGQLSLFNLLKAYSLLDGEVGYCQGLSFVAGVLLMHVSEERAFDLMKHLMFRLGFRRQYCPDMVYLQIQMYQLSRLLHDFHKDLYDHFELNEIAPTLYAAPWFLTIFASQFPIGFVARVFDLIFLQGIDVVLKVALALLGNHKELIKQCIGFEAIVEFLKSTLPEMVIIQMERVVNEVFAVNISKQLEAYEVEYHVLQEEMNSLRAVSERKGSGDFGKLSPGSMDSSCMPDRLVRLQVANDALRRQKIELLEQLQISRRHIHSLEEQNQVLVDSERKLNSQVRALELERTALLSAVATLRRKARGTQPFSDDDSSADVDTEVAALTMEKRFIESRVDQAQCDKRHVMNEA